EDAWSPFFSPDGQWVGFLSGFGFQLKKFPVSGGTATSICPVPNSEGASWAPDNTILLRGIFAGILRVPAGGAQPTTLVAPEPSLAYTSPQVLPDGRSFLYTRTVAGSFAQRELVIRSLDRNDDTVVLRGGVDYKYLKSGYIIYSQSGNQQTN